MAIATGTAIAVAGAATAAGVAYSANKASKASKEQIAANKEAQNIVRGSAAEAGMDARRLFDRGLERQAQGFGNSIDLLAGGMQPQADMMNQGNMNAQNTLLSGGQGYMNAILGGGGNPYAGLQAKQVTPEFSYLTNFLEQQQQPVSPIPQGTQSQYNTPMRGASVPPPNIGVPDWIQGFNNQNVLGNQNIFGQSGGSNQLGRQGMFNLPNTRQQ